MELFRNGYIVAVIRDERCFSYDAWPLYAVKDEEALQLTDEADERWFIVYAMLEIAPDLDYAKRYAECCRRNGIDAVVLLAETSENAIVVNDEVQIEEVYGFDCIGTIGFSYLRTDIGVDVAETQLNRYGLFNSPEDVVEYSRRRREVIASGLNLEDYWEEVPMRLSRIKV